MLLRGDMIREKGEGKGFGCCWVLALGAGGEVGMIAPLGEGKGKRLGEGRGKEVGCCGGGFGW